MSQANMFNSRLTQEISFAKKSLQVTKFNVDQAEKKIELLSKVSNSKTAKDCAQTGLRGHKLVHLDLNGAPPKMSYLIELLPFLRTWGATGLLIEYVDMFPFTGELQILSSANAYREDELKLLQRECHKNGIIIIPLVQTFGHLEYVLKHAQFAHLRETQRYTNSLCPKNKGSVELVKKIINQVSELHPHVKWIHVGGDEVWNLKTCDSCEHDKRNESTLFLRHMLPILSHVKTRNLSAIMWDDMMRDWKLGLLKRMSELVEPMLWGYKPSLQGYFSKGMWRRYGIAFPRVWIASAFKGAFKPYADFVPIKDRLRNNLKWLEVVSNLPSTTEVMGIALTGWSRYDYFGTLCELLPAALPSLVICLTAVNKGFMNSNLLSDVSTKLGFRKAIDVEADTIYNPSICNASFPGHEVYSIVCKLTNAMHKLELAKDTERGWILDRQLQANTLSYFRLEFGRRISEQCVNILGELQTEVTEPLSRIYYNTTIDEWIKDKLDDNLTEAKKIKILIEQVERDYDEMLKQEQQQQKQPQRQQASDEINTELKHQSQLPDF